MAAIDLVAGKVLWLKASDMAAGSISRWPSHLGDGFDVVFGATATNVASQTPLGTAAVTMPGSASPVQMWAPASSQFDNSTYRSDNAANSSASRWASAAVPSVGTPQWIRVKPTTLTTATSLTIVPFGGEYVDAPGDFTIRGSVDGTTWTTLDTRTSITWASGVEQTFSFTNTTAYAYYEIRCTRSASTSGLLRIQGIKVNGSYPYAFNNPGEIWMVVKSGTAGAFSWNFGSASSNYYPYSDGRVYDDSMAASRQDFAPTLSVSSTYRIYRVRIDSSGVWTASLDGVTQNTTSGRTRSWSQLPVFSGFNGRIAEMLIFNDALGSTDAATVAAYLNAEHISAGSSAVSVAAPVLAVVEAAPAPVVTAGVKITVAAPALALAAAMLAPTVVAGTSVRVDAPTLAVSTSLSAPTIVTASGVTVAAPALSVTVAAPAPAVSVGSSVAVTAPALGVTFAVPAPTVTVVTPGVNVAAPVLSLITAIPAPAITGVLAAERAVTSLTHTPVGVLSVIPLVPSTELDFAVPVTRTSILAPVLSEAYPAHPEQGHEDAPDVTRATVGYVHLWIDGQDVTYFRGAMTVIRRWESESPFGDTVAAFEFPQLNPWDVPGEGDLSFLRPDAPVSIGMSEFDGALHTVRRLWDGFLDARGNGLGEGEDYAWEAKGTMWAAQHQIREPFPFTEPVDIGVQFARTMNAVEGRTWRVMPVVPIGITTMNRGSRDESHWDYLQSLLSEAVTDDGRQWTLNFVGRGLPRLVLKPASSTVHATVAYGTPGVDIDLRVDESTRVDRIYGRGITSRGGGWANMYYPALELLTPPAYPMDGLGVYITLGTSDADTLSGTGVTDWQRRVSEFRAFANPAVSGVMSSTWVAVIDDVQRFVGVTVDSSLGPQTWNATFDRAIRGVDMRPVRLPLASKVSANKYLYTAAGVKTGLNPAYDSRRIPRDIAIDFGPGKTKAQGRKLARTLLGIYGTAAANGTIQWTFDPQETDRTRLSHLSNVKVKGFEGSDRVLQVSSKTVELEAGDDGPTYVVTTRVDERARDAMAVEDLLEQRRSAQPDPSRRPGNPSKASRQVSDQRTPWDSESPCGVLRRTAVNGASGLWTVVTVPMAEVGKLAGIRLRSDRPFYFALLASLRITENKMKAIVGNPSASSDPWRAHKNALDEYGVIEAWGEQGNACGYSPQTEADGGTFTGDFILDTPVDYWTETPPYVSVAIYMGDGSGWIEGEFIPAYEP